MSINEKKFSYDELLEYLNIKGLNDCYRDEYEKYEPLEEEELISKDLVKEILGSSKISGEEMDFLMDAIDAVEADEKALAFMLFFRNITCQDRSDRYIGEVPTIEPEVLGKYKNTYAFILELSCLPPAFAEMEKRQIPEKDYRETIRRAVEKQERRFGKEDPFRINDLPWDLNFYTLSIFFFDRFLFIPCRFEDKFELYRNENTDEVVGVTDADVMVDGDGLAYDEETFRGLMEKSGDGHEYAIRKAKIPNAFITTKEETDEYITGYPMNPCGIIENEKITIDKKDWKKVLEKDDRLLALHIPEGEGYTPERMRSSMKIAREFFAKHYPEVTFTGFWSESWLYDKQLGLLLGRDRNISRVQMEMFVYTCGRNGQAAYEYLFGNMSNKLAEVEKKTSLQKKAAELLMNGGRFATPGMIFMYPELDSGKAYWSEEQERRFTVLKGEKVRFKGESDEKRT